MLVEKKTSSHFRERQHSSPSQSANVPVDGGKVDDPVMLWWYVHANTRKPKQPHHIVRYALPQEVPAKYRRGAKGQNGAACFRNTDENNGRAAHNHLNKEVHRTLSKRQAKTDRNNYSNSLSDGVLSGPLADLRDISAGVPLCRLGQHLHAHVVRHGRLFELVSSYQRQDDKRRCSAPCGGGDPEGHHLEGVPVTTSRTLHTVPYGSCKWMPTKGFGVAPVFDGSCLARDTI